MKPSDKHAMWYRSISGLVKLRNTKFCPPQSSYVRYRHLGSTFNHSIRERHVLNYHYTYPMYRHIPIDDSVVRSNITTNDGRKVRDLPADRFSRAI